MRRYNVTSINWLVAFARRQHRLMSNVVGVEIHFRRCLRFLVRLMSFCDACGRYDGTKTESSICAVNLSFFSQKYAMVFLISW